MRAALDAHLVKQVVPVLRRLRNRNPAMRVFAPIGLATLESRDDMENLVRSIEREIDIAPGFVFELQHADLGRLDNHGIEGLARFGRLGATLALGDVQVSGLDLSALRQLGVRFLSFPPAAANAVPGAPKAWAEFIQYARAMQFQVIVAGVDSSQQAIAARQFGRYAHGAFFAPPRKVRADAGVATALRRSAAA
jgi:EAL domain-containing protein (putative c-di-GMP-specific phosphodiesterase class I)